MIESARFPNQCLKCVYVDVNEVAYLFLSNDDGTVTVHQEKFYSMGEPDPDQVLTRAEAEELHAKLLTNPKNCIADSSCL